VHFVPGRRGDVNLCRSGSAAGQLGKGKCNGETSFYTTPNLRIQSLDMLTLWEYTGDVERAS
jgi:hypothetical protein